MVVTRFVRIAIAALIVASGSCDLSTEPSQIAVRGIVRNYFTEERLGGISLTVDGAPDLSAISAANGDYLLNVPPRSSFLIVASGAGYRSTRNPRLTVGTWTDITSAQYIVADSDVRRQYTAVGLVGTQESAEVFVDFFLLPGIPLEMHIPVADIVLLDSNQHEEGEGPFIFGDSGDIVPQEHLGHTMMYYGRSRAAFLNVSPGSYTLQINHGGQPFTAPVEVTSGMVTRVKG